VCDGVDNDCDGVLDPPDVIDNDGDGFAVCAGDCEDWDDTIYPGAPEFCDNVDTDCDGAADNGFDQDGDGIPDCVDRCPMVVDFDTDPWGDAVPTGDYIDALDPSADATDAYQNWGISVERYTDGTFSTPEAIYPYDSSAPTLPGYEELGTRNESFGGLGWGAGGQAGQPGENAEDLNNVIRSTDGNTWYLVNFTSSTCVHSIDLIDVDTDELEAQVILFDVNVQQIATYTASGLGDNSVETLDLGGTCGVFIVMIDFYARGAWDNLTVCVDPLGEAEVCGDSIDNDGDGETDEGCDGSETGSGNPLADPNAQVPREDMNGEDGASCTWSVAGRSTAPWLGLLLMGGLIRRRRHAA
jgi:hypothetical protein